MKKINLTVDSNNEKILTKVKKNANFLDSKLEWTIKFSDPLDIRTINSNNMYVVDSHNVRHDMSFYYDEVTNNLTIKPLGNYLPNESYSLVLTKKVKSKNGRYLHNELVIHFAQKLKGQPANKDKVEDIVQQATISKEDPSKKDVISDKPPAQKTSLLDNSKNELTMTEKYGAQKLALFKEALSKENGFDKRHL